MEYLTGLTTVLVLFLCVYLGYRIGQKKHKPQLTEQDQYKIDKRNKELEEIFSYNLNKAIKGVDR